MGIPPSRLGAHARVPDEARQRRPRGPEAEVGVARDRKLETLAASQVASELKLATPLVVGLGAVLAGPGEPRQPRRGLRLPLDARTRRSATGPARRGHGFNASRTEGQLVLPAGAQCVVGTTPIRSDAMPPITSVTGDSQVAFTAAMGTGRGAARRTTSRPRRCSPPSGCSCSCASAARVRAYSSALSRAHASLAVARGVIADELRRAGSSRDSACRRRREPDRELLRDVRVRAGPVRAREAGAVVARRPAAGPRARGIAPAAALPARRRGRTDGADDGARLRGPERRRGAAARGDPALDRSRRRSAPRSSRSRATTRSTPGSPPRAGAPEQQRLHARPVPCRVDRPDELSPVPRAHRRPEPFRLVEPCETFPSCPCLARLAGCGGAGRRGYDVGRCSARSRALGCRSRPGDGASRCRRALVRQRGNLARRWDVSCRLRRRRDRAPDRLGTVAISCSRKNVVGSSSALRPRAVDVLGGC